ncbi:uncharacterized protein Z520_00435 [Fonsecaea multimorphosa CBS 102226]|uniref:Clr5 domain-containing protein n=1 Tax=Fonsecaea multimorphosa CBS 102226 TaxID=1442371 RepID=A0A0D2L3V5_9EURO|nr:uncharacterized protein Z520_00435 [Fonsecaea multimorphosa CBS 102226]KIY03744.1 hypothetical protein Z520_00435 [Fonsecaea multimorphosa CBS 102226]OAL32440.1 hypothetical protein AYO22_00462 [Fonsecaea multimorphosa]
MPLQRGKAETTREPQSRSRRIPDHEYDQYREKILRLYREERRSREDVIRLLAHEDGFSLSLKQLKHVLQKWGVRKNIKSSDREDVQRYNIPPPIQGFAAPANFHAFELTTRLNEPALKRRRICTSSTGSAVPATSNGLQRPSFDNPIYNHGFSIASTGLGYSQSILGDLPTLSRGSSPLYQTGLTLDQVFGTQVTNPETSTFINTSWPIVPQSFSRAWPPENNYPGAGSLPNRESSPEVDPRIIARLLLNLHSVCSKFPANGRQWQHFGRTFVDTIDSAGFVALCNILKSRWFQAAMNYVLHYPEASARMTGQHSAITMTQDTGSNYFAPRSILEPEGSPGNVLTKLNSADNERPRWGSANVIGVCQSKESDRINFASKELPIRFRMAGGNPSIHSVSISYLPRPRAHTRALGLSLTLQSPFDVRQQSGICTGLKTVNVIPQDSDAFKCIKRNDLSGLQKLFNLGQASPFDVDPEGGSLLFHAIHQGRFEIFRLLLNVGASIENVVDSVDIFVTIMALFPFIRNKRAQNGNSVKMAELVRSKNPNFSSPFENGLYRFVRMHEPRSEEKGPVVANVVGCLKSVFEVEWRCPCGQTPLLFASLTTNSIVVRAFVANGADTQTTDGYGRGALHAALYYHSFVVCPNGCGTMQCNLSHECTCPLYPHTHREDYCVTNGLRKIRIGSFRLKRTLLVLLVDAKCNPNVRDVCGLTPSDYARRRDKVWRIWQRALEETGYAYDEESGECYKTYLEPLWSQPGSSRSSMLVDESDFSDSDVDVLVGEQDFSDSDLECV